MMRRSFFVAVVGIGLATSLQARADTFVQQVTSSVSGYREDSDNLPLVLLPGFDPDRGTLTGVTLQVEASGSVFASGLLANTEVPFQSSVDLIAPYNNYFHSPVSSFDKLTNGIGSVEFHSPSVNFSQSVALEPDYLDAGYDSQFFVRPGVNTFPGYLGDGDLSFVQDFEYRLTETFFYTPVPEPASLSLLSGALVAMASFGRWRGRISKARL